MKIARAFGAGIDAVRKMVPRFLSLARELALEIVGFVFLAFGAFFLIGPWGFVNSLRERPEDTTRLIVSAAGAVMFAWFGVDSFRRAKRLARKR